MNTAITVILFMILIVSFVGMFKPDILNRIAIFCYGVMILTQYVLRKLIKGKL